MGEMTPKEEPAAIRTQTETLNSTINPAELCRRNGWGQGTRLVGTESGPGWSSTETITITAVGQEHILARCDAHDHEGLWSLRNRSWHEVDKVGK